MRPMTRYLSCGTALSAMFAGAAPAVTVEESDFAHARPGASVGVVQLLPLVLAGAIVVGGASTASAAGGGEDQGFSTATVIGALVRVAVNYGRLVADIRYDALEVDGRRGALTLRDLRIGGLGGFENCQVDLGKLELSGLSFWGGEDMRSRFEISNLSIAANCFGPSAAMIGMVTGSNDIPVESLVLDVRQVSSSAATTFDIVAVSPGIARLELSADFDYLGLTAPFLIEEIRRASDPYGATPPGMDFDEAWPRRQPEFGVRGVLKAAHVTVEDLGLWARVQPILPPDVASPEMIEGMVWAPEGGTLHAVQEDMAGAMAGFIAEPGHVTVEIRPAQPLAFDSTDWRDQDEEAVLALLAPDFTNAPPSPPVALIAAPEAGDDPLALGLALADGIGVPQNSRRAIELLAPLEDNAEAMLAVARLAAESDPAAAYGHALRAAVLGDGRAAGVLDRIEVRMATDAVLAAQPPADTAVPDEVFASVTALRAAALAHAEGDGVARSYALARRLAGSAAAAGDGMALSLVARLDTRFGGDPDWIAARDAAADLAMEDWTGLDLATRFAAQ